MKNKLALRPENTVMQIERLGSFHQTRLSFMRCLLRRVFSEAWQINIATLELDNEGYGHVVYEVKTESNLYSFVVFSHYLDPSERSDRVIAERWDLTMALCEGRISEERLSYLAANVPLQEMGRMDSKVIVLSRANRSERNFDYVVDCLAVGKQPDTQKLCDVGYLYRTTAVYGSGKFGMADWTKVHDYYCDFNRPFAAEMFACFMLREFSSFQVAYIARMRSAATAVDFDPDIRRFVGIGNSTGLGMAPYLINHPLLISHWVEMRESALATVVCQGERTCEAEEKLSGLIQKVSQHLRETQVSEELQQRNNAIVLIELGKLDKWLKMNALSSASWHDLQAYSGRELYVETQELLNALLLELYPTLVDNFENSFCLDEQYRLEPSMLLSDLQQIISRKYAWAMAFDFDCSSSDHVFWYRSEEKMEPRLGERNIDLGEEKQMIMGVARTVQQCSASLEKFMQKADLRLSATVADFLLSHGEHRDVVRRMQTMAHCFYGEIQANLLDENVKPMHLLRCKLSFFGVSKFDPRSRLWVRNTMFQGAPALDSVGAVYMDDWCFPVAPRIVA
ncbi:MAG: hypothetical protein AB8B86_06135 [Pseudomonadales bacterium]